MNTIKKREKACAEAKHLYVTKAVAHPLQKLLKEVVRIHGPDHGYSRDIKERLWAAMNALPEWVAYENAWIALKAAREQEKDRSCQKRKKR